MKKSYWIIIALFVILLIVATIMFIPKPDNSSKTSEEKEITEIVIKQGKDGVPLKFEKVTGTSKEDEEDEDEWEFVYGNNEHKITGNANNRAVNNIVDSIKEIDFNDLKVVIKNTEDSHYYKFGVSESSGIYVDVYYEDESKPKSFIMGNSDDSGKRTFICFLDKEKIYSTFGSHKKEFTKSLNDYRDKAILKYNTEDIVKITYITEEGKKAVFEKEVFEETKADEENVDEDEPAEQETVIWTKSENGETVDKKEIEKSIRQISNLNASSFWDYPPEEILEQKPMFEVIYEEASGTNYNIKVIDLIDEEYEKEYGLTKDNYIVRKADNKNPLYLVSKYTIDSLMKLKEIKTEKEKEAEEESNKENNNDVNEASESTSGQG